MSTTESPGTSRSGCSCMALTICPSSSSIVPISSSAGSSGSSESNRISSVISYSSPSIERPSTSTGYSPGNSSRTAKNR